MEELSGGAESLELAEVRRGWCMGGAGFRERMPGLLATARAKLPGGKASRIAGGTPSFAGWAEVSRAPAGRLGRLKERGCKESGHRRNDPGAHGGAERLACART